MSAPRRRIRRFAKYVGLVLCAVILVLWLKSRWQSWGVWYVSSRGHRSTALLEKGRIEVLVDVRASSRDPEGWTWYQLESDAPEWVWSFHWEGSFVVCPLWIPFFLVAIPTIALWYVDRRPRSGRCPECRYDLTGNTTNVCPECGQAVVDNQA